MDKKNQKINGEWKEVPYYVVDEKFHFGGHGSKSVFLVQQFMKLTTEEAAAINCHMGFSDGSPSVVLRQKYGFPGGEDVCYAIIAPGFQNRS